MLGSFHIVEVRGVPIRIHFTAIFLLPLILRSFDSFLFALCYAVMILFSVALHELGHTVVAQRYGMTVQDIILTPIGGVARLSGIPDDPHQEIRIALAGPYISLLLALSGGSLFWLGLKILPEFLNILLLYFAALNLILFVFNLIPCFPMDGGRVLRAWLSIKKGALEGTRIAAELAKYISIFFIVTGLAYQHPSLTLIGFFILFFGGSEYRMMKIKAWQAQSFGNPAPDLSAGNDFVVSPPPYETSKHTLRQHPFLKDLMGAATDLYAEIKDSRLNF